MRIANLDAFLKLAWNLDMHYLKQERNRTMSILKDKKIIIIGDRDGIPGPAVEECIKSEPTAEVVFSATECFV